MGTERKCSPHRCLGERRHCEPFRARTDFCGKAWGREGSQRIYGVKAVANELEVRLPGSSRRSDEDVAAACVNALKFNALVPDEKIKVGVDHGWITLDGEVEWQFQRNTAENAIRYLIGVTGVTNSIRVKAPALPSDVKTKIEAAFKRSAELDARRVSVKAHDGKVILHGNVRSWTERQEAQRAAWAAPGVTQVENEITVTP